MVGALLFRPGHDALDVFRQDVGVHEHGADPVQNRAGRGSSP
jgi:hypothetical protein